jgi:hypothetical protein
VAAHDRRLGFAAAGVRDVVDFRGSMPEACAIMPARMWSEPPAEPPPHATLPGFALNWAISSLSEVIFEVPGTTTTSYSPVRRAIGVTCDRLTGDLFEMMAPTITIPPIISAFGSPLLELTNWAIPIVPPAPPLLSTVIFLTVPSLWIAACSARPVWSQPPPGAAGTRILRLSMASASAQASKLSPATAPQASVRRSDRENLAKVRHEYLQGNVGNGGRHVTPVNRAPQREAASRPARIRHPVASGAIDPPTDYASVQFQRRPLGAA